MRVVAWLFASLAAVACNSIDGADKYQNVDAVDGSGDSGGDVNNPDGPQTCTQACLDQSAACQGTCAVTKQDCMSTCQGSGCNLCSSDFNSCTNTCVTTCTQCNCTKPDCQNVPLPDAGISDASSDG